MGFRIKTKKLFRIASDLGVCDSNRIAHRGCIARFNPLRAEHYEEYSEVLVFEGKRRQENGTDSKNYGFKYRTIFSTSGIAVEQLWKTIVGLFLML